MQHAGSSFRSWTLFTGFSFYELHIIHFDSTSSFPNISHQILFHKQLGKSFFITFFTTFYIFFVFQVEKKTAKEREGNTNYIYILNKNTPDKSEKNVSHGREFKPYWTVLNRKPKHRQQQRKAGRHAGRNTLVGWCVVLSVCWLVRRCRHRRSFHVELSWENNGNGLGFFWLYCCWAADSCCWLLPASLVLGD